MTAFDAVVLAASRAAQVGTVCGLTLAERGRRVAVKSGAVRVRVVDGEDAARSLPVWAGQGGRDVVILRAADQVVHLPLVDAVTGTGCGMRVAVDGDGAYAGAIWVPRGDVAEAMAVLAADPERGDRSLVERWRGRSETYVHGAIARHRAVTAEERAGATRMLFELVHKKDQDGWLSRRWFRPVASVITRALLPTPVTPNMVTAISGLLCLAGCVLIASSGTCGAAVAGLFLQHVAGYLDCTDGEIARLRHESSRSGMWFDTIVDETTTVASLGCLGWHVYLAHPGRWFTPYVGWSIPIGVGAAVITVYVIYFYLVRVARSGNSQDYPVARGGWVEALAQLVHRDFVGVVSLVLALVGAVHVAYAGILLGAVVSATILVPQHLALRADLAAGRVVPRPC